MFYNYLVKGLGIGMIFGAPFGAIGALGIERTVAHGRKAGMATGVGAGLGDVIYAIICVLGSSLVSDLLIRFNIPLSILGGVIVITLGYTTYKNKSMKVKDTKPNQNWIYFGSSFALVMMNPSMILLYVFAQSFVGAPKVDSLLKAGLLLAGIFGAIVLWWLALCLIVGAFRKKITDRTYAIINTCLSVFLMLFGVFVILRPFLLR
jgi:putative LysE/RhtB family amino acid efflux pump